jgi:D-alanyl-D-alanine carboxypeptidase
VERRQIAVPIVDLPLAVDAHERQEAAVRTSPQRRTIRRIHLPLVTSIALVTVVGIATVAPARVRTGPLPAVQRALDDAVAAGAPGAIAFIRDDDRTVRLASGLGSLDPETPIRVADRFRLGGLTKTFTATVVLQLVGEGTLALDDTLEHWMPGAISNGEEISLRRLLDHTSGIYDYAKDPTVLAPYLQGDFTRVFDPAEGVRVADEHGPLFPPGTDLAYSNTNTILLAMIVEAATGRQFASELNDRIFQPLNLGHTSYPTTSDIDEPFIHGYLQGPQPLIDITPLSPTLLGAAGGMISSAKDVARFYRALLQGELLEPEELAAMQTIDPAATGGVPDSGFAGGGWGLGLLKQRFPCGRIAWGHDSEIPGYQAAFWSSKDGSRQVLVVVNSLFEPDDPASRAIRRALAAAFCR